MRKPEQNWRTYWFISGGHISTTLYICTVLYNYYLIFTASSWILLSMCYCARWKQKYTEVDHSPKVTLEYSEEFRPKHLFHQVDVQDCFVQVELKTWKKIHCICEVMFSIKLKAIAICWWQDYLISVEKGKKKNIAIKKTANAKNAKRYLKFIYHFRNNFQYVVRPSRLNFFQTPENYNPYTQNIK